MLCGARGSLLDAVVLSLKMQRNKRQQTIRVRIGCSERSIGEVLGISPRIDRILGATGNAVESEKLARRERRKAMAKKMHEARLHEHKKRKLRSLKMDLKKHERAVKKMNQQVENQQVENQARQETADAAAAAKKLEELKCDHLLKCRASGTKSLIVEKATQHHSGA
jgi:hypothetical protein